ncbi:integral membrane protein [Legionella birminghamensis]|uniref:Integral membrane protein n=1 Tax=Legionella birminghamensis TaxID=28083 RepID=A0A378ICR6_9GAMM|nr:EamA family transporter [Legionella birminghamensis]KTC66864.1 integral membrane protein [Legionella birminghamensis]STX32989.1 integral membrane protein [Legionella birminghamensis]
MPAVHLLLTLVVVVVWGVNFLFVKLGLEEISPLLLCALRFGMASLPAIFFIKPPALPVRTIISYGLVTFALQFTFFFVGMYVGMTPGMASLIIQTQVFFSMLFALIILKEKPNVWQLIGAMVSFIGIGLVALHFDNQVSFTGFICLLGAAAAWGLGNLIIKKGPSVNMMAVVVWGSFVAFIPMLILAIAIDGLHSFSNTISHLSWKGIGALFYIVYMSTWVGYGVWNWLLSRYPIAVIVPYTLLVPVVGMISSSLFLGEPFQHWKLNAALLVLTGLIINILSIKLRSQVKSGPVNAGGASILRRVEEEVELNK